MISTNNDLYHIHRKGSMDNFWHVGAKIKIVENFENILYEKILKYEKLLTKKFGNYDIDYIIAMMEEIKFNNLVEDDMCDEFDKILNNYYLLRREKALEEGRKLFAPNAPQDYIQFF